MLRWAKAFQRECKSYGVPLVLLEGRRSNETQAEYFARGFTKIRKNGPHVVGYAVDLVHGTKWWDDMTRDDWLLLSQIGKEIALRRGLKIEWGGDWKWYDAAHWQIPNWRTLPEIPLVSQEIEQHNARLKAEGFLPDLPASKH